MPAAKDIPQTERNHARNTTKTATRDEALVERLAMPVGVPITRVDALELFKKSICASDLDSILPIKTKKNRRGPPIPTLYNSKDVVDLMFRLSPNFGPDVRVEEDGEQISHSAVRKGPYNLEDVQIRRIKPTSIKDGEKFYNIKDVQEQSTKVRNAAARPTGDYPDLAKLKFIRDIKIQLEKQRAQEEGFFF